MTSDRDRHLSRISTIWSDIRDAPGADQAAVRAAQDAIMERYSVAIHRYRRSQRATSQVVDLDQWPDPGRDEPSADEAALTESLRDELLARAWGRLEPLGTSSATPFHRVLSLRVADPQGTSEQLAERLNAAQPSENLAEKPDKSAGAPKILERARLHLAQFVLDEVAKTLSSPSRDELADEVRELGLYAYCRRALERR